MKLSTQLIKIAKQIKANFAETDEIEEFLVETFEALFEYFKEDPAYERIKKNPRKIKMAFELVLETLLSELKQGFKGEFNQVLSQISTFRSKDPEYKETIRQIESKVPEFKGFNLKGLINLILSNLEEETEEEIEGGLDTLVSQATKDLDPEHRTFLKTLFNQKLVNSITQMFFTQTKQGKTIKEVSKNVLSLATKYVNSFFKDKDKNYKIEKLVQAVEKLKETIKNSNLSDYEKSLLGFVTDAYYKVLKSKKKLDIEDLESYRIEEGSTDEETWKASFEDYWRSGYNMNDFKDLVKVIYYTATDMVEKDPQFNTALKEGNLHRALLILREKLLGTMLEYAKTFGGGLALKAKQGAILMLKDMSSFRKFRDYMLKKYKVFNISETIQKFFTVILMELIGNIEKEFAKNN